MQALSMRIFGVNEFAARFPNAIGGIVTLVVLYEMGRRIHNARLGALWALVYAGSILPFFYFKSGIIDPWFNLFIFSGVYQATLYLAATERRSLHIFLSGLLIGLGVLTKGPVALLIFGLVAAVWLVASKFRVKLTLGHVLLFLAGLTLTGGSWFAVQIATGHADVVREFITYQIRLFSTKDAGHGGFPGYHVAVLAVGLFPASAFFLGGLWASPEETPLQKTWRQVCIILLFTVLILFEIVRTKILHYSSLAYFPLTFLAALSITRTIDRHEAFTTLTKGVLIATGGIVVLAITGLCLVGIFRERIVQSGLIRDPFVMGNLQADVPWTGYEWVVALIPIAAVLLFLLLERPTARIVALFSLNMLFVFSMLFVFTDRIAGHTQKVAVDFYKSKSAEDCYIQALGFKSYAHLFYGNTRPHLDPSSSDSEWLAGGEIDKPAYFVYKVKKREEYRTRYPKLTVLYEKNGFVFAARHPEGALAQP
jgi:4-amino-4-deoxy-L-arabinose transferase-like glycosyltransferase